MTLAPELAPTFEDLLGVAAPKTELITIKGGVRAALVPRPEKFKDREAGREIRRGLPIHGYFGRNGNGKSLAMVHDTLPDLYAGEPVLSTVALLDAETGDPYPNFTRLTNWEQLMSFSAGAVLFDEIVGVAGAREGMSLPVQVQNFLVQLRRDDMALRWTAPSWARADKIIRETSQGATLCRGFMPKRVVDQNGRQMTWRQRRLFIFKTYNAEDFEEWTAAKESGNNKLRKVNSSFYWAPGGRAQWSYDTYDDVSRISLPIETGRCISCGGTKRSKPCSCAS